MRVVGECRGGDKFEDMSEVESECASEGERTDAVERE